MFRGVGVQAQAPAASEAPLSALIAMAPAKPTSDPTSGITFIVENAINFGNQYYIGRGRWGWM